MTLTTIAKPLRIMREPYYEKEQVNHSLMSPPLTPTEVHHPTTTTTTTTSHDWYYPISNNKRKEFITSYSRMVPYLKTSDNNGVFALNVYRDILLKQQQQDKGNHSKINKKDCVMLDETVVPLSRKRTFCSDEEEEEHSEEEEDKTIKKVYKKKKRVSSILPTGKEAALAFDAIDIDSDDQDFYPSRWVPYRAALDQIPVKVCWKGAPLSINQQPYFDMLHKVEVSMASTLRLSPVQYLRCKRTLILAARTLKLQQIPFTKSVAQKLCRVDVNKTSALWTAFGQLGWFDESNY